MKPTPLQLDLNDIYSIAYPHQLPFGRGEKDSTEFFYAIMLYCGINSLSVKKVNDLDIPTLYLYYLEKSGLNLQDLYNSLKSSKFMKETNIDQYLYQDYSENDLFDDINNIREDRWDIFMRVVGIDDFGDEDFEPVDFFNYNFDPLILTNFNLKKNPKPIDDSYIKKMKKLLKHTFGDSITFTYEDSEIKEDPKYSEIISREIQLNNVKLSDVKKSIQHLIKMHTYHVDEIKSLIMKYNSNEQSPLVAKKVEQLAGKDMSKEMERYSRLREIDKYVIGQNKATSRIVDKILGSLVGFKSDDEPVASFLLTGPTGVGKTETAKTVAKLCSDGHIYIVDMSTYKTREDISRLVGASPNYVGYDDPNPFCDFLKAHPNGVLLFDEIDKADYACLDVLMRTLDEAEFVDAKGVKHSLKNNIIFCTTNLSTYIHSLGFNASNVRTEDTLSKSVDGFRKEILARFSDVIEYEQLSFDSCRIIAKNFIEKKIKVFSEKNKDRNITLTYTDDLIDAILSEASTNLLGARDLKKYAQNLFVKPITEYIISNNPTDVTITVSANNLKVDGANTTNLTDTDQSNTTTDND